MLYLYSALTSYGMKEYKYSIFTTKIEKNIRKGILKPGDKLPSVRQTKAAYKLSTTTVQNGYDYLVSKGLVTSIPKSGYVVSDSTLALQSHSKSKKDSFVIINSPFRNNVLLTSPQQGYSELTALNAATPSDTFISQKLILQTMQQVIRDKNASLLRYYPNNGSLELREQIAKRLSLYEIPMHPNELIITDGALQALYIALAAITSPNDIIAVESPCPFSTLQVIASLKLRMIEIPVRLQEGLDVDYLKKVCAKNTIQAILVTPNFHNPTGIQLTNYQKEEIYTVAQSHRIPIIENDIYGDLYFDGSRPSTIRHLDTEGLVLTYSSYSKTIAPGIRLGWLAAGKFVAQVEQIKFALGRSVSPINQETISAILQNRNYDKHLKLFKQQLKQQASLLASTLSTSFPKECKLSIPQGGYSLWCQLPATIQHTSFFNICQQQGISFTPGETFSFANTYENCFRATFSHQLNKNTLNKIAEIGLLIS